MIFASEESPAGLEAAGRRQRTIYGVRCSVVSCGSRMGIDLRMSLVEPTD